MVDSHSPLTQTDHPCGAGTPVVGGAKAAPLSKALLAFPKATLTAATQSVPDQGRGDWLASLYIHIFSNQPNNLKGITSLRERACYRLIQN